MNAHQFKSLVRDIQHNLVQREQMIADFFPAYSLTSDMELEAIDVALKKVLQKQMGEIFG